MPKLPKFTLATKPDPSLPTKHVAILFEGAWLLTPDPDDVTRVRAICPYVKARDHVCDYGIWQDIGGASGFTATIEEGDAYRVDMQPKRVPTATYREVFDLAAAKYGFVYVDSVSENETVTGTRPPMARTISVPVPDAIRAAGKLADATITPGQASHQYKLGIDGKPVSLYVTFLFIYYYSDDKPVFTMTNTNGNAVDPLAPAGDVNHTHLLIRVHELTSPKPTGSPAAHEPVEVKVEDEHFVDTFNMVRHMISIQASPLQQRSAVKPDFILKPSTKMVTFIQGDSGLTTTELGLPAVGAEPAYGNLAACAGGIQATR